MTRDNEGRDPRLQRIKDQVRRYDGDDVPDPERPHYQVYEKALLAVLNRACNECGVLGFVQARAKATASFAEKITRKGQDLEDPVTQFTDLCGARVIGQTQEDVDRICAFVRRHFKIDEANSPDVRSRLAVGEFGYLSEHLVVQFPWATLDGINLRMGADVSPEEALLREELEPLDPKGWTAVAETIGSRKAEIQVRTLLQHAWSDVTHDRIYKGDFRPPARLARQIHRVAALLEEADGELQEAVSGVDVYNLNYATFLEPEQIAEEIARWQAVLQFADGKKAEDLALKIARLAAAAEDWRLVSETLERFAEGGNPAVLRELGLARAQVGDPAGRDDLTKAVTIDPEDVDSHCYLGDTYCHRSGTYIPCGQDDECCEAACRHYGRAFELAPAEPHALRSYLECRLCQNLDMGTLGLLRPGLETAIRTCRDRADIGVYVPYAYYDIGCFALVLGRPYESLSAFAKAVHHSRTPGKIESALSSVGKLQDSALRALNSLERGDHEGRKPFEQWLRECEWARRFLLLARAVKLQQVASQAADSKHAGKGVAQETADAALAELRDAFVSPGAMSFAEPVVIVAGGTDQSVEEQMASYGTLVMKAFSGFAGTVISGGTTAGISGIIGGLPTGGKVEKVSYLPDVNRLPEDAVIDRRYDLRQPARTPEDFDLHPPDGPVEFTALEPLQCWIDLVCSGVGPGDVTVIGINGGKIAAFEYRLALAMGATVGIIQSSGRAAEEMLAEADEWKRGALAWLPADAMSLRAFVQPPQLRHGPFKDDAVLDRAAACVHEEYRAGKQGPEDPALKPWPKLDDGYKDSNRQQVLYAECILKTQGYGLRQVSEEGEVVHSFSAEEVERMAEMEHGRFVAERLRSGWRYGPERDKEHKTSPYLCAWEEVPDEVKEYDRKAVRGWPAVMAHAGLKIVQERP